MCPSQSNFRRRSRSRSRSGDRRRVDDRRGDYDRRRSIRSNSRSRSGSPRGGSPGPHGRYYESRQSGDSSVRPGSPARQQYNSRDFGRNVDESKSQSQSRNRNWSNERSRSRSQDSHRNGRGSDYSRSRSRSLSYKSRSRSSSSSYSRSRSGSRSRSRSRNRNRSRSRSRSRSRNRSYDRQFNDTYKGSREGDRGSRPFKKPYDFDDIERSEREPADYNYDSYEDEDEDDYDSGRRGHRPQKRGYKEALTRGEPNDVLLVSGAQSEWTKNVILKAFESICPLGAVQIVRSRKGYMAPFCYVEVYNKEIAEKLVNATNGKVMVGGKEATLYYAKRSGPLKCDWFCQNCHFLNFASRCETGICFRCCAPRPEKEIDLLNRENEQLEHYIALSKPMEIEDPCTKLISNVPTTTILLRGLDNMTTEETIASHFSSFGIEIASVQLIRSKETLLSFGAARVTFDTVEDCQKGMAKVQSAPLSGVVPQICFAKPIDTATETDIFIPETRRKLIEEQEAQLREWDKLRQETEREQPAAPPEPIPEPAVNEPTPEEISAAAEKTADDEFNALLQEIDAVSQKETQKQEALKNVENEQMTNGSEEELVDYNRLVCLLCQRQFNSIEQLTKHVDRSQLHKDNLAKRNTHQKETRWGKPSWQQRQHQYQTKWDTASKSDAAEPSSQTEAQFFGDTARGGLGFRNSALAQQQQQGKDQQEQKFQSRIQQYVNNSYTSQKFRNFARYDWHAGEH